MVDVILSKSANKQLYKNLAERLEQLKEYFVKFCGEQYRDKIEYFFEDCKFLIIDKTCPDVQKKLLYASPKEDDSSAYFNMSILQNASEFSKGGWQTQTEEIDKTLDEYENFVANGGNIRDNENENWPTPQIMQEIIFPTVRECKDLVKEAADRFYSSLFSMIKNNTDRDSPNHIYKYAFGYAIRPVFEKIAEIILTKNNYTVKDNFKYSIDNYVIPDMMKCCASFGLAKKDPNYVFNVASELFQYSTTGNFKDKTPEEYIVMAKEIRMVGNFLVNEIIDNITTSFEDASDLAFYDECEDMVDKAGNKDLMPYVEDFYNALNTAGQAVRTNKEDNKQRPFWQHME